MLHCIRWILIGTVFLFVGCGDTGTGKAGPEQMTVLRDVDGMIRMAGTKGEPKGAILEQLNSNFPFGFKAFKDKSVTILWGASMADEDGSNATGEVVAYETKVPTEGGYVLLQDGNVKMMSASDFQSAKKFEPKK